MSNYIASIRTNYFSVTDPEKFKAIIASCRAEYDITIIDDKQADGSIKFGFYCYGSIQGLPDKEGSSLDEIIGAEDDYDCESSIDLFFDALQDILPDGEAIIITEVGYEKMRYLVGYCTVITRNDVQGVDVQDKALELARNILQNNDFTTKMDY